jgi:hypothetical protein
MSVKSIEPTIEKIQEIQEASPEIRGIQDTISRCRIYLKDCLLFEGTIRIGDKEIPFANLVRSGKRREDIRKAMNIIFLPGEGHHGYEKSNGMSETYIDDRFPKSVSLNVSANGEIRISKYEICDEKERRTTISNNFGCYKDFILGYKAIENLGVRIIENSIDWDDGSVWEDGTKCGKFVSYALVYSDPEAKIPVEILENEDEVRSVYKLGEDEKYEKVARSSKFRRR